MWSGWGGRSARASAAGPEALATVLKLRARWRERGGAGTSEGGGVPWGSPLEGGGAGRRPQAGLKGGRRPEAGRLEQSGHSPWTSFPRRSQGHPP